MCRWKGSWHKSKKRGKESSKLSKVQGFEKLCGFQKSPWLQGDRKRKLPAPFDPYAVFSLTSHI